MKDELINMIQVSTIWLQSESCLSCWSIHLSHFITKLNPLTPVPPVTTHDEPWPLFHFWCLHLWSKLASSVLNFYKCIVSSVGSTTLVATFYVEPASKYIPYWTAQWFSRETRTFSLETRLVSQETRTVLRETRLVSQETRWEVVTYIWAVLYLIGQFTFHISLPRLKFTIFIYLPIILNDLACSVKMARYWPHSYFVCLWPWLHLGL